MGEFWPESREDKLIELWVGNPCLYDITSREYSDRNKKAAVMAGIAETLSTTVDDVNRKLRSLRTQYTRLKKTPPGANGGTKRQDWLLRQMEFLAPHIRNRSYPPTLGVHDQEVDDDGDIGSDHPESVDITIPRSPSTINVNVDGFIEMDSDGEREEKTAKSRQTPTTSAVKRRKISGEIDNREHADTLHPLTDSCGSNTLEDKCIDAFGRHVIMQLRKIGKSDPRLLCIVQNQIQQVIFNGLMETFNSDPKVPDHSRVTLQHHFQPSVQIGTMNSDTAPLHKTQENGVHDETAESS